MPNSSLGDGIMVKPQTGKRYSTIVNIDMKWSSLKTVKILVKRLKGKILIDYFLLLPCQVGFTEFRHFIIII